MVRKLRPPKPELAVLDTCLALIRSSVGSKTYRNCYFRINGKKIDVLRDGELSCAMFVSVVLHRFGLLRETHTTVAGTVEDMERRGWRKIRSPKTGAVIVWGPKLSRNGEVHRHIGFYLGGGKAVSNSSRKRSPAVHHWTYGRKRGEPVRRVEAIYWNRKLA